jgi:hypothetical protein
VTLAAHPTLVASVRIGTSAHAAWDRGHPLLPAAFCDDPATRPFSLAPVRSGGGEVDVLELADVEGAEGVTQDHPLVLRAPATGEPGDVVLPLVVDGETCLPAGVGAVDERGDARIRVVRLTDPARSASVSDSRSRLIVLRVLAADRQATSGTPSASPSTMAPVGEGKLHDPAVLAALREARTWMA